jgi:hypothetical protein
LCTHTQFKDAEITTLSAGIQNEVLVATVLKEKQIGFSSQMQLKDVNIAERDKVFESLKTLIASRELEIKILKEEIAVKDLDLHERVFRTAHAQRKWDNLEIERLRTQLSSDDLEIERLNKHFHNACEKIEIQRLEIQRLTTLSASALRQKRNSFYIANC